MPIYEYECRDCGHQFEWLTRDGQTPSCPSCGQFHLTKQLSLPVAHVVGAKTPPCPAKQDGLCAMPNCCGRSCGLEG
jgi:putative FmdB family regulatory protein